MTVETPATDDGEPKQRAEVMQDAVSALMNLGYRQGEVGKTFATPIQSGRQTLEDVIKDVLRRMSP